MAGPNYASRRTRLLRQLTAHGVDSMLVSQISGVRYLTGFSGDSSWLFLSESRTVMVSDTRFSSQLSEECPDLETEIRDARRTMNDVVADVIRRAAAAQVAIQPDHLTVSQYEGLQSRLKSAVLVNPGPVVDGLREIKDRWELDQIREAVRIAERGLAVVRSLLRSDLTERQIRFILEDAMRGFGADGTAFEPIVGVGSTGALPHAHAGERRVRESPALLIDWGARTHSGYCSDLTRVLFTGRPTRQMQHVYQIVLEAQQAAVHAVRPGLRCQDLDQLARDRISDAGFGK